MMRWKHRAPVMVLVLALALLLAAGCGRQASDAPGAPQDGSTGQEQAGGETGGGAAGEPQRGGTLVVALPANPMTYNPNARPDDAGIMIFQNLFNKLVTLDDQYQVIPDLADDWHISEDGLTYTFYLHPEARWHDGQPVTSADV